MSAALIEMLRLRTARWLMVLLLAVACSCLVACADSSQPASDPSPQPASSATAEQAQPTQRAAQQAQQESARTSQSLAAEPAAASETEQSQTVAAQEPAAERSAIDQSTLESDAQQAQPEQAEDAAAPEQPEQPRQPVLRLWDHDGDNPSGLFHNLIIPADYDAESPLHLVLYLHGRSEPGGQLHTVPMRALVGVANAYEVAVLAPFPYGPHTAWNAADGCCEDGQGNRDDVSYYHQLVTEAREFLSFDRLSIVGEYTGGWMAYRLACEGLPGLSAIAVLEASFYGERARCDGARPLSVFHVHPTGYALWRYLWWGGDRMGWNGGVYAYPPAEELVRRWADRAGCDLSAVQPAVTLSDQREETVRLHWAQGCSDGVAVELWGISIRADELLPSLLTNPWAAGVLTWLDTQAQVRDLDEPFQPGAEPAPRPIEFGVWTRDGRLESLVLDTDPPATIVRPFGVNPDQPVPMVIPLPGMPHGDVWHDAAKWGGEMGRYEFALLLPGYGYRRNTSGDVAAYLREISALAHEHINVSALYVSGDSGGGREAYGYIACHGLDGLVGVIAGGIRPETPFASAGEAFVQECPNPVPISILHRIGTRDAPLTFHATTGFEEELREWAELAGCDLDPERLPNIDVDWSLPGDETEVLRWREGCRDGITVELWRVVGAGHSFGNPNLGQQLVEWMLNEARVES